MSTNKDEKYMKRAERIIKATSKKEFGCERCGKEISRERYENFGKCVKCESLEW